MTYRLLYTSRAERDIKKLPPDIKRRIGQTLLRYKQAPHDYSETLADTKLGTYRFRIGDYRVIFDIDGNEIIVLRVGHRRDIYRRL
jgi:mRNA interferase RelE/StbE